MCLNEFDPFGGTAVSLLAELLESIKGLNCVCHSCLTRFVSTGSENTWLEVRCYFLVICIWNLLFP